MTEEWRDEFEEIWKDTLVQQHAAQSVFYAQITEFGSKTPMFEAASKNIVDTLNDTKNNLLAFISQQRKEAAREALEAAAREVQCIREGLGHNQTLIEAAAIIRKHIEDL